MVDTKESPIRKKRKLKRLIIIIAILAGITIPLIYLRASCFLHFATPAEYNYELEDKFKSKSSIPIGAAVTPNKMQGDQYYAILEKHFDSITPENHMKWAYLEPSQNSFSWEEGDYLVEYAQKTNSYFHGHVLVWHNQLPEWVEEFSGTREEWKEMLKNHVQTIVSHYKGQIDSWDVVNEAFDGAAYRNSIWYQNLGPEYITDAFRWAHEADPDVKLYYNDYDFYNNLGKVDFVMQKLSELIEQGVPIHGIGLQCHVMADLYNENTFSVVIEKFEQLGLDIRCSELDVSLNTPTFPIRCVFSEDAAELQKKTYESIVSTLIDSDLLRESRSGASQMLILGSKPDQIGHYYLIRIINRNPQQ